MKLGPDPGLVVKLDRGLIMKVLTRGIKIQLSIEF